MNGVPYPLRRFLRRVRGLLGMGLFAGITWSLVGAVVGTVVLIVDLASIDPGGSPVWIAMAPQAMLPVFVVLGSATIAGALALAKRGERLSLPSEPKPR